MGREVGPVTDRGVFRPIEGVPIEALFKYPGKHAGFSTGFDFGKGANYLCGIDKLAPDGLMSQGESRSGV
jgi:hypothetical protein